MANFGFARLKVVAPYAPHWREARSAIGAPELLQSAIEVSKMAEAVSDCTLVLGTGTLTYRKPEQRVVRLPDLAPLVEQELERGGSVALVFGPEKHGLTRDDLSFCHALVEIPTDEHQPSMNLGQAVAVCLYELATRVSVLARRPHEGPGTPAADTCNPGTTSGRLELVAGVLEEMMEAARYSPASMREANRHDLRLLLRRLALSEKDGRRILGFFRRVLRHLKQ